MHRIFCTSLRERGASVDRPPTIFFNIVSNIPQVSSSDLSGKNYCLTILRLTAKNFVPHFAFKLRL